MILYDTTFSTSYHQQIWRHKHKYDQNVSHEIHKFSPRPHVMSSNLNHLKALNNAYLQLVLFPALNYSMSHKCVCKVLWKQWAFTAVVVFLIPFCGCDIKNGWVRKGRKWRQKKEEKAWKGRQCRTAVII